VIRRLLVALAAMAPPVAVAQDSTRSDPRPIIRAVELRRIDVFSPAEASTFLPRLANDLHITTRAGVIRRELLFHVGEPYDSAAVAETARNLRSLGVFRSVAIDSVRSDSGLVVRITTADGWSTRPITNLHITGSTWVPTIGVEELNFLGTATLVSVRYRIDPDRSTLVTSFRQPRLLAGRVGLSLQYAHLSDGDLFFGMLNKPFFSLATRNAWQVYGEARKERILRFYEGSRDARDTLQRRYSLGGGAIAWALRGDRAGYFRVGVNGQIRRDDYTAVSRPDTMAHTITGAAGLYMQWRRARFLVSSGLEGFGREQDVDVSTTIGSGFQVTPEAFGYPDDGVVPFVTLNTGFGRVDRFVQLGAVASGRFTSAGLDSGSVHLSGTAYLQPVRGHLAVLHGAIGWKEKPAPGAEFDLGLGLGPRGFLEHAFTGDRAFFTTAEYRVTLSDDFLKLSAIGLAGFLDYGGAWYHGSPRRTGVDFGIGLRFGLTRSTEIQTSRVDLACRERNDAGKFGCVVVLARGMAFSTTGRLDR
jgi:hypothetical protein